MYEKRKSVVQASLDFLFYARRTSNSHHERYSYSLLGPGTLTAHRRFHLVLLHSCPDTVHGVLLRKTQTSTSLIEGSFAMKEPSDWHHPRCSGLRVQGTAISPAARNLLYSLENILSIHSGQVTENSGTLLCEKGKYYIILKVYAVYCFCDHTGI